MEIRPTPKQREAGKIAAQNLITLYGGAIRGGKSYWLLLLIFTYAMQYDKSRWACIRAYYSTLTNTLLVTFNKLLSEGLGVYVHKFTDNVCTLTNGSQIIFFAENYDNDKELNRFRGLEVNGFGIDEINEIQRKTFYKCIERAGSWQGSLNCPQKIFATCNPTKNWVKEDFYNRFQAGTLPKNWAYVPSKITDNPHIELTYINSLKENMLASDYKIFVEGSWDIVEDPNKLFARDFDLQKHTADSLQFEPTEDVYLTFDLNYDPTCLVIQYVNNELRVLREYHKRGLALPELLQQINKEYNGFYIINGDASGHHSRNLTDNSTSYEIIKELLQLTWRSFNVPKANPTHKRSRILTNVLFKVYNVKIDKSCVNLIADLESVEVDENGSIDPYKKKNPERSHWLDAFRYYIYANHQDKIKNMILLD